MIISEEEYEGLQETLAIYSVPGLVEKILKASKEPLEDCITHDFGKNKIFAKLSGKYDIKRTIENYGYGEGWAYFLEINPNELLYKEELSFNYYGCDNQIFAVKEYKYILENNNIIKYFTTPENSLFYQLDFINNIYSNDLKNWNVKQGISTHSPCLIGKHVSSPKFCRANSSEQKSIKAVGRHLCGKDHYNATYIFLNPDSFILNYQVLGPEKNYNINSSFTRI